MLRVSKRLACQCLQQIKPIDKNTREAADQHQAQHKGSNMRAHKAARSAAQRQHEAHAQRQQQALDTL
eukprot:354560-Chlamydomonas_euryale.AAC.1